MFHEIRSSERDENLSCRPALAETPLPLAAAYLSAVAQATTGDSGVAGQVFNVVAEDAVAEIDEAIRTSVGADRVEFWPLDDARKALGPNILIPKCAGSPEIQTGRYALSELDAMAVEAYFYVTARRDTRGRAEGACTSASPPGC